VKRSYYYFIASLPCLSFSQPKALSYAHFLSLCSSFLENSDFDIIKSISLSFVDEKASPLDSMKKWAVWDEAFRNELARMRADRLKRQIDNEESGESSVKVQAALAAREVFGITSPFLADEERDKARWEYLNSLEFGRYFDMDWLALYSMKLLLLERRETFDQEKGLQRFQDIMAGFRENYEVNEEPVEENLG